MGYKVELAIPDVSHLANRGLVLHFVNAFAGRRPPPKIHAIATTFVRLTEASVIYYGMGRNLLEEYWAVSDSLKIAAGINHASHFESCITDVNRARACMNKLRNRSDVPSALKNALPRRLKFIEADAAQKMESIRHEIQHVDEHILNGTIPDSEGTPFALYATGPEEKRNGDTVKTVDRLRIGTFEILFSELADWLGEMANCAQSIGQFRP